MPRIRLKIAKQEETKQNRLRTKDWILNNKHDLLGSNSNWIYFLLWKEQIIYVGSTTKGLTRIIDHQMYGKHRFDSYSFVNCPLEHLIKLESEYIVKLQPPHNTSISDKQNFIAANILIRPNKQKHKIFSTPGTFHGFLNSHNVFPAFKNYYYTKDIKQALIDEDLEYLIPLISREHLRQWNRENQQCEVTFLNCSGRGN